MHPISAQNKTIALVSIAHGTSHYFHLLVPPLFVFLIAEFQLDYATVGTAVSVFFIVSGVGQSLAGFLVDRLGARPILFVALGLFVAASLLLAVAPNFHFVLLASALAGLGNCFFHPVDYSILNQRVQTPQLGFAYSAHSVAGYLGWALAPTMLVGLSHWFSWRVACLGAAMLAAACWLLCWFGREYLLHTPLQTHSSQPQPARISTSALLRLPVIWWSFGFFFFLTISLGTVQSFVVPVLQHLYNIPLENAALALTAYMASGALGTVVGGFLPNRVARLERVIGLMLLLGSFFFVLLALQLFTANLALVTLAVIGFLVGTAGPSRDMLVKQITPAGASGRVYGIVYSGLDLGLAVTPAFVGHLLDKGQFAWVFVICAAALVLAVAAAWYAANPPQPRPAKLLPT